MSTDATSSPQQVTSEHRVAKLFGLEGDKWMRHSNPLSVWTRFAVLPLLIVSVWSRAWIGWWCLVPVALSLIFMVVNPLLFPVPRSTRNWASKGVLGERIWAERNRVTLPDQFASSRVPMVAPAVSARRARRARVGAGRPGPARHRRRHADRAGREGSGTSTGWCCSSTT